jgi:DNA-binding NarL/FixJ family response regulator
MTAQAFEQTVRYVRPAESAKAARRADLTVPLRALVVHEDLSMRLRVADLLLAEAPGAVIDSCSPDGALALEAGLRQYTAAVLVLDMGATPDAPQPLALIGRLRAFAPGLVITVIGRGSQERSAVEAMRAGAADYWPLHHVDGAQLMAFLRARFLDGAAEAAPESAAAPPASAGYRLIRKLAQSAGTTVYLGHSARLDRAVAIKCYVRAAPGSAPALEGFGATCERLMALGHRAVGAVYDHGVGPDHAWLAMEYFPAGSLAERLARPLPEAQAFAYAVQIGEGLAAAHAAGLVHGNLSPANVMLRADGSLGLVDFQLAEPAVDPAAVGLAAVRYRSPEQLQGAVAEARSDLYALGLLLVELLTGEPPFQGTSVAAVRDAHLRAPAPVLPTPLAPYQPIVNRLLAKSPEERCRTADDFLQAMAYIAFKP